MTEAALRLRVAPPPVLIGQLDRLASLATLSTVDVCVDVCLVPLDAEAPALPLTGFALFELEDDPPQVTVETLTAELDVSDEREVARYRETAHRWRQAAARGHDVTNLLDRVRGDLG